ncbi:MAG: efflux RND transporter periplasmic adaptor subunit [Planktomarina sp.]
MRFLRKSLSGLFLLAFTIGFVATAISIVSSAMMERMSDGPRGGGARERVFAVNVVPFEIGTQTPVYSVFGEVRSTRVLDMRAPVGGTITALHPNFADGGVIKAGDLVVTLDPSSAQTALSYAKADLAEAQAEERDAGRGLDLAQQELSAAQFQSGLQAQAVERQKDLLTRGVGTAAALEAAELSAAATQQSVLTRKQALTQAQSRLELATARVDRRKIAVAEAERNLRDTQIFAPFDGTLSGVALVEGGAITAGQQLGQVVDAQALEVAIRVSNAQYMQLLDRDGTFAAGNVQVSLAGSSISTDAQIIRESPVVGEGQTGRLLFASVNNPQGLRPGDFVGVTIEGPALRGVARLPAAALGGNNEILIVGEDDRLAAQNVDLIRREKEDILVRNRDLAGAQVVAQRSPVLGAGIKVRVLDADGTVPEGPKTVTLTDEERAKYIAFVEANTRMPPERKEQLLQTLAQPEVPTATIERLNARMGG